jgi:hypothetical protein
MDFSTVQQPGPLLYNQEIYAFHLATYPPSLHVAGILDAEICTVGGDPFGQVISGPLRISGPCHNICSCRVPEEFFDCNSNMESRPINYNAYSIGTPPIRLDDRYWDLLNLETINKSSPSVGTTSDHHAL